ncbi:unnamed protein product [Prorocentrum cordatum]|uniref:Uncharacterized protein n=1 Tax=Prorocentrum cordatum TaxID=2364126 RepID=A0ABN9QJX9_9DINO|nr:unnamed protein product [Polarella glacialis]
MSVWRPHDAAATQHVAKLMDTVKAWGGLPRSGRGGALASDGLATVERAEAGRQSESEPTSDCAGEAEAVAEADLLRRRRSQREQDAGDLVKAFCAEIGGLERSHPARDPRSGAGAPRRARRPRGRGLWTPSLRACEGRVDCRCSREGPCPLALREHCLAL